MEAVVAKHWLHPERRYHPLSERPPPGRLCRRMGSRHWAICERQETLDATRPKRPAKSLPSGLGLMRVATGRQLKASVAGL